MAMSFGGGWMAPQPGRGPYDSVFAPRPDMVGPLGPQGYGFGLPPNMAAPMPGTQGLLGPHGVGTPAATGLLQPAAQQQSQSGVLNLTPQMIQQILQSMGQQPQSLPAGAQQIGTLNQLNTAQRMMGVGGQR